MRGADIGSVRSDHKAFVRKAGNTREESVNRRRIALGTAVLVVVLVGAWVTSPERALSALHWLVDRPLLFGLLLLAVTLVRPFLAWPTTPLAIAAGYGYGLWGVPIGVVLLTLTAVPPYFVADRAVPDGRLSEAGTRLIDAGGGVRTVAASRLLPAPSDVVTVACGAASVSFRPFLVGTAIGELPWVVGGVLIGISAESLLAEGLVFDVRFVAGLAILGVLLLAGPIHRAYEQASTRGTDR